MSAFTWGGAFDLLCWLTVLPALGFAGYRALRRSAEPAKLVVTWAICAVLLLLILSMIASADKKPAGALFVLIPSVFLAIIVAPRGNLFIFSLRVNGARDNLTRRWRRFASSSNFFPVTPRAI